MMCQLLEKVSELIIDVLFEKKNHCIKFNPIHLEINIVSLNLETIS